MFKKVKLKKQFECLGLSEEEIDFYMESELDEGGNPSLAPLVMFKEIWGAAVRKGNNDWLTSTIDEYEMRKSLEGAAAARWPQDDQFLNSLKAVVDSGIELDHITNIVCQAQEHLLYQVAYVLGDSYTDEELHEDVNWALFQIDNNERPVRRMEMLHELFHAVDPDRDET